MASLEAPSKHSIREANDHIKRLYSRINELEETIKEQAGVLLRKDEYYKERLQDFTEERLSMEQSFQVQTLKIQDIKNDMQIAENKVKTMAEMCKEKDAVINRLQERCNIVDEAIIYIPVLENLLTLLRNDEYTQADVNPSLRKSNLKLNHRYPVMTTCTGSDVNTVVDGHSIASSSRTSSSAPTMAPAISNITRGFNINQNFSASEDEDCDGDRYL